MLQLKLYSEFEQIRMVNRIVFGFFDMIYDF